MSKLTDADMMAAARNATATATEKLKAHPVQVGSSEASRAGAALDHLGMAYHHLRGGESDNPAWSDD